MYKAEGMYVQNHFQVIAGTITMDDPLLEIRHIEKIIYTPHFIIKHNYNQNMSTKSNVGIDLAIAYLKEPFEPKKYVATVENILPYPRRTRIFFKFYILWITSPNFAI